jgi:hypothetical protein
VSLGIVRYSENKDHPDTVGVLRDGVRVARRCGVMVPVETLGIFNSFPGKIKIERRSSFEKL